MVHEESNEDNFATCFTMYSNYSKKKNFGTEEDQSSAPFESLQQGFGNSEMQRTNNMYNSMISRTPGMGNLQNVQSQQFGRNTASSLQAGSLTPTNNDNSLMHQNRMNMYPINRAIHNQLGNPGMQSPTQSISPEMYTNRLNATARNPAAFASQQQSQQQQRQQPTPFQTSVVGGNEQFPQLHRTHPNAANMMTSPTSPIDSSSAGPTMGIAGSTYMEEYPPLKGTRPIGSQTGSSGGGSAVATGSATSTGLPKSSYGASNNKRTGPTESSEFTMQSEDFPALPAAATGINNHMNSVFPDQDGRGDESNHKFNPLGVQIGGQGVDKTKQKLPSIGNNQQKTGIQILPDNTVKNIPNTMLRDQYGIVGLLAFIKAAETEPALTHLALGTDLTTLGLNLNSPDNLFHKFQSPFSRQPCRLQDIDYYVPSEYLTNTQIRDKLAPIKLARYGEDLLFFVFYSYPGDIMQFAAAAELYNRDWRFHKEERVWITRAQGVEPTRKTNTYEQGTYLFFDCKNWKKTVKEFYLDYDKLEERPQLPNLTALHYNPSQHG